jgi:peptidyl-prolyl cis-trans isomerase A (cyclophilin A)
MQHTNLKFIKIILILLSMALFWSCSGSNPRVLIKTGYGDIVVELFPDLAPVTVSNFMKYVEEDRYEGAIFYRVVRMDNQPDGRGENNICSTGRWTIFRSCNTYTGNFDRRVC